jgi:predicted nucleotidyltransferase
MTSGQTLAARLESASACHYSSLMMPSRSTPRSVAELRKLLRPFCEKHRIRRLEIFGSAAREKAASDSDVDLLVTLGEGRAVSTADLLEMAGEAEELVGAPVDSSCARLWRIAELLRPRTYSDIGNLCLWKLISLDGFVIF